MGSIELFVLINVLNHLTVFKQMNSGSFKIMSPTIYSLTNYIYIYKCIYIYIYIYI